MLPISDLHTIIGFCQCRIHNGCDAITLTTFLLTQRNAGSNIETAVKYSQPVTWWTTVQDVSREPLFGLLT